MTPANQRWVIEYAKQVDRWLTQLYGKHTDPKRDWIADAAIALLRQQPPPPPPNEGKTQRPWRAAQARLETLQRIYNQHAPQPTRC